MLFELLGVHRAGVEQLAVPLRIERQLPDRFVRGRRSLLDLIDEGLVVAEQAGAKTQLTGVVGALMIAVFCFNLLGDGLRDIVDPQRRT